MRRRRQRVVDRIPDDVLARARKAGITRPDWYAGRRKPDDDRPTLRLMSRSRLR